MSFDGVEERESHGEAAWFHNKGKQFAMFWTRHHGGPLAFLCPAPPGVQEALVQARPDRFFRPPYVGPSGWIGVILEEELQVDWDEVADILAQAHALTAPRVKKRP